MQCISFIRHSESYANKIKKENNKDYLFRKIIKKQTLEDEKNNQIENRIFDPHITVEGIIKCLNNKINPNKNILILISPLIRNILTTFFLFYDCFINNYQYKINIIINKDLKEKFFHPYDFLENYNFPFSLQIEDIKKNIINNNILLNKINISKEDIIHKFNIFINLLDKNNIKYGDEENIFLENQENQNINNVFKKEKYLKNIKIIIKKNKNYDKIFCISHWGVMKSLFQIRDIKNLQVIEYEL